MKSYEPNEKEMRCLNLVFLQGMEEKHILDSLEREYLESKMDSIIEKMIRLNETDHSLVYEEVFLLVCSLLLRAVEQ